VQSAHPRHELCKSCEKQSNCYPRKIARVQQLFAKSFEDMKMNINSKLVALLLASSAVFGPTVALAQVAGAQPLGVSVEVQSAIINGWSVKKSILNKPVVNDDGQKVGVIHDIIVAPDHSVSFAIIAANQFLGVSHHDVAIPIEQFDVKNGKLVLPGATKDAIKALPEFQYTKVRATPISRAEFEHH
jgi:sporulation protein YlmC with PRC-barrel domain